MGAALHFLFRDMKRRFGEVSWCYIGVSGVSEYMSILRKHSLLSERAPFGQWAYLGWALVYWLIVWWAFT